MIEKLILSDNEWKQRLSAEQYRVLRRHGTEAPFCSKMHDDKQDGTYACAACGLELFSSADKFVSGTGWPSFSQPIAREVVEENRDLSHDMVRTEVHCARCEGHLGHVFEDGPPPTGLRYCMNGVSLEFQPAG